MKVQYIVACDECPGIVEEDAITFHDKNRSAHEIAQYLAETYMCANLYEWEDTTEPGDLFNTKVNLDNGIFVVEFYSNSPFSNSHYPDHTINVQILSID